MNRVLIIEDNRGIAETVREHLVAEGYEAEMAGTASLGLERAREAPPQVVILDLMLPDATGESVLCTLRAEGIPAAVLILSARSDEMSKVRGFRVGADDYLTKPFDFGELLARLRALTRRRGEVLAPKIVVGDLVIDTTRHLVTRGGREIPLTTKEFTFLHHLARNAGRVVSRAELMEHVWDDKSNAYSNIIDVYASRLRRKLDEGEDVPLVVTLRGTGFMLNVPADDAPPRPEG